MHDIAHTSQADPTVHKYEVHPKSNWKMWIKWEWLQLGGKFFGEFLKASIADLITCCFHHYETLKAVATATAAIVVLTPANFYHFQRPKLNFQPLSFTFETFGKNLKKQKSLLGSRWRKKRLLNLLRWSSNYFLPKFVNNGCWGFAEMLWVNISS